MRNIATDDYLLQEVLTGTETNFKAVIPVLIEKSGKTSVTTTELITLCKENFELDSTSNAPSDSRNGEAKWEQQVRNIVSHASSKNKDPETGVYSYPEGFYMVKGYKEPLGESARFSTSKEVAVAYKAELDRRIEQMKKEDEEKHGETASALDSIAEPLVSKTSGGKTAKDDLTQNSHGLKSAAKKAKKHRHGRKKLHSNGHTFEYNEPKPSTKSANTKKTENEFLTGVSPDRVRTVKHRKPGTKLQPLAAKRRRNIRRLSKADEKARAVGKSAERIVYEHERELVAAKFGENSSAYNNVLWTSEIFGDGYGYDVQSVSCDTGATRYIEVKATVGNQIALGNDTFSENEINVLEQHKDDPDFYLCFGTNPTENKNAADPAYQFDNFTFESINAPEFFARYSIQKNVQTITKYNFVAVDSTDGTGGDSNA